MDSRFVRVLAVVIYLVTILCLPAAIDADKVFAYQSQPDSLINQNMPQSPGNLTLHGQWKYYPRGSSSAVAAKYYLIGIYNADTGQALAYGHTNNTGTYAITFPNPGTMIKVKILTDVYYYDPVGNGNHWITVAPPGGNTYQDAYFYTPQGDPYGPYTGSNGLIDLLEVPNDPAIAPAWWIKDDLDDGYLFLPDKLGDYFAVWQAGWNMWEPADGLYTAAFFDSACCWSPWCQKSEAIHLNSKAAYGADGRDRVIHEMGHAVMYYAYDNYLPCDDWGGINYILTCMNHQVNEARTLECAWIEGWGNFWSLAVQNDTSLWGYNLEIDET